MVLFCGSRVRIPESETLFLQKSKPFKFSSNALQKCSAQLALLGVVSKVDEPRFKQFLDC